MSRQEILITPIGEMLDLLACLSIYEGGGNQKIKKDKKVRMEDFLTWK